MNEHKSRIAIITYNIPHRKTQDILFRLKLLAYHHVTVLATPFVKRQTFIPIFYHRPANPIPVCAKETCGILNYQFQEIETHGLDQYFQSNSFDFILIGGAGILPKNLVENHQIINSHPGILPHVRGLDSLKWAVYNKKPIGVTSHIINHATDAGLLIERKITPVYENDTFHSVAQRQYEMEIELLVNSILVLQENKSNLSVLDENSSVPTKRMPRRIEENLLESFDSLKRISLSKL